jgi:hypothetical protein
VLPVDFSCARSRNLAALGSSSVIVSSFEAIGKLGSRMTYNEVDEID